MADIIDLKEMLTLLPDTMVDDQLLLSIKETMGYYTRVQLGNKLYHIVTKEQRDEVLSALHELKQKEYWDCE